MNYYSEQEQALLFDSLKKNYIANNNIEAFLITFKGTVYLFKPEFKRVMFISSRSYSVYRKYGTDGGMHREIMNFINDVLFDQVPLFINDLPELVAWRLRIGK